MTRVVVVRHGETDWNRNGRMQGWAPVPLNETGREQAAAVGEWLAGEFDVDRVLSSDLLRTKQTTEHILERLGDRPVDYEPHWRERDLGVYQGLTYGDVEERFSDFGLSEDAHEAAHAMPESGESLEDVAERVTGRFDRLLAEHDGETVLVVTHGGPLHVLLGYVKEMDLRESFQAHYQANCAVNELLDDGDDVRILRENERAWR